MKFNSQKLEELKKEMEKEFEEHQEAYAIAIKQVFQKHNILDKIRMFTSFDMLGCEVATENSLYRVYVKDRMMDKTNNTLTLEYIIYMIDSEEMEFVEVARGKESVECEMKKGND